METFEITIGSTKFRYAKVNLTSINRHLPFIRAAAAQHGSTDIDLETTFEWLIEMAEIIHECIGRCDPEVKLEDLLVLLDIDNVGPIFQTVMKGPGG